MKHAKLSASGSYRWLICSGSIQAEEKYKNENNIFSVEGSVAHELADMCCKAGVDAIQFLGKKIPKEFVKDKRNKKFFSKKHMGNEALSKTFERDMCEYVQDYLNYVKSYETENSVLYPEQRVDFSNYIPEGFGTSDNILIVPDKKTVHIFDLKYGKGVQVWAKKNSQGMLYGVGVMNDYGFMYDIKTIVIHIIQPRLGHYDKWKITPEELYKWANYASKQAAKTLKKNPKRTAGDHCTFCKAKDDCKALLKWTEDIIGAGFEDISEKGLDALKDPFDIEPKKRAMIINSRKMIEKFMLAVFESSVSYAEAGGKFVDLKLVEGRTNRKYKLPKAEKKLKKKLGKKAYKPNQLINLGEAEKLLGRKEFADLDITDKPKGSLTLVDRKDKRPEVTVKGF